MDESKIGKLTLVIVAISLAVGLLHFFGVDRIDYRLGYSRSEAESAACSNVIVTAIDTAVSTCAAEFPLCVQAAEEARAACANGYTPACQTALQNAVTVCKSYVPSTCQSALQTAKTTCQANPKSQLCKTEIKNAAAVCKSTVNQACLSAVQTAAGTIASCLQTAYPECSQALQSAKTACANGYTPECQTALQNAKTQCSKIIGGRCENECSSGSTKCTWPTGNILQTCGNYDSDSCLEWPSSTTGPGNSACSGSTPYCYTPLNNYAVCVQCLSDAQCSSGQACISTKCASPYVSGISPVSGSPGASITITGYGFNSTGNTVTFTSLTSGIKYSVSNLNAYTSGSATSIDVKVPNTEDKYDVSVTTSSGTVINGVISGSCPDPANLTCVPVPCGNSASCTSTFTVYVSPPFINLIQPSYGPPGATVRVDGYEGVFSSTGNTVTFTSLTSPGTKYSVSNLNAYQTSSNPAVFSIDVKVPNTEDGYDVSVTTSSQTVIGGFSLCDPANPSCTPCGSYTINQWCSSKFTVTTTTPVTPSHINGWVYITPNHGPTNVVTGYGFSPTGNTVTFTSLASPGTNYSVSNLNAVIQSGSGSGSITVSYPANMPSGQYTSFVTTSSQTVVNGVSGCSPYTAPPVICTPCGACSSGQYCSSGYCSSDVNK